jgi:outer membrane protein
MPSRKITAMRFKLATTFLILLLSLPLAAQEKLSLDQLIDYALKNNILLQRALNTQALSAAELTRSRANLYPSVSGNASHNYNFGKTVDPTTNQFSTQHIQTDYVSLNANLLLFNGLSQLNHIRQEQWARQGNVFAVQKQMDDVKLTVANYYLQILMLTEREKQVQNQMANSKEQDNKTKILVDAGALAESKKLETSVQVATDQVNLIDIQNQLKNIYLQLKQYLNYDMAKDMEVVLLEYNKPIDEYSQADLDKAIREKAAELPLVKQARNNLESSKYALKAAIGNYYPSLYASGALHSGYSSGARKFDGYTIAGSQPIGYLSTDRTLVLAPVYVPNLSSIPFNTQLNNNYGQSAGFTLSIPIFNGLQNVYNAQLARVNLKNAELTLNESTNKVKYDIYQAYESMQMSSKKYAAAKSKLKLQEALYNKADVSYKNGLMGYYDYNTAKITLNSAQSDELQSRYENIFQTKVFEYYLGKELHL